MNGSGEGTGVMEKRNLWLLAAGMMSAAASFAHLICIIGGPTWYLFMGAPPKLVQAAEGGDIRLVVITMIISTIIAVWAIYAFSAAGMTRRIPFTRFALLAISCVLLFRGVAYFVDPLWQGWRPDLTRTFLILSSLITFMMGLCFAIGTWQAWPTLQKRK